MDGRGVVPRPGSTAAQASHRDACEFSCFTVTRQHARHRHYSPSTVLDGSTVCIAGVADRRQGRRRRYGGAVAERSGHHGDRDLIFRRGVGYAFARIRVDEETRYATGPPTGRLTYRSGRPARMTSTPSPRCAAVHFASTDCLPNRSAVAGRRPSLQLSGNGSFAALRRSTMLVTRGASWARTPSLGLARRRVGRGAHSLGGHELPPRCSR
jgi:hypothetical protein